MERRALCLLWDGKDLPSYSAQRYGPRDVLNLARNLRNVVPGATLTVIADDVCGEKLRSDPDLPLLPWVRIEPLRGEGCGGWSNVFEAFAPWNAPRSGERVVELDLDLVFMQDASWLWRWRRSPVGLHLDPIYENTVGCGIVTYNKAGADLVWRAFLEERDKNGMADFKMFRHPSEMMLLRHLWKKHEWLPLEPAPERLLSYKVHVLQREMDPTSSSVVYFHGSPKVTDLKKEDPVRMMWESR